MGVSPGILGSLVGFLSVSICVSTARNSLASLKDGEALQDEELRAKTQ